MGLFLLFLVPAIAFGGLAVAMVAVLGLALPWIASHSWGGAISRPLTSATEIACGK